MNDRLISVSSERLTARINPLGAELWSLVDSEGHSLMTDADPTFWTGRAPILFPIVGALVEDAYSLSGRRYTLAKHGFARRSTFTVVQHDAASAVFRLDADEYTRACYPFDFRLDMRFSLAGATLQMAALVSNLGKEDMPFSFGYHPAFAWPLPFGAPTEAHRIVFDHAEPAPLRQLDSATGLVAPDPRPTPVDGAVLTPTYAMFEQDALIWDQLSSRSLDWGAPLAPSLHIEFPDMKWLGVWQKPGAHYLCIEPWAGMADPAGFVGEIWKKPGIIRLPPGESRRFRMSVTLTEA